MPTQVSQKRPDRANMIQIFYLFSKLTFSLKGERFHFIEDVQANTEKVPNTIKKENFLECFQK